MFYFGCNACNARWGIGEVRTCTCVKEKSVQQKQEPVAVKHMMEWIDYLKRKSDYGQHMQIPSEMSAGACWDLAIELEQFINTITPQRTWVGLTDEEKYALSDDVSQRGVPVFEAICEAESKLKEKNQ